MCRACWRDVSLAGLAAFSHRRCVAGQRCAWAQRGRGARESVVDVRAAQLKLRRQPARLDLDGRRRIVDDAERLGILPRQACSAGSGELKPKEANRRDKRSFHALPLRFLIRYKSVIPRSQQACGLQLRLGRNNCLRDAPPLPAQHVHVLREEALCRHLAADRRRARRPHVRPGTSRRVSATTVQTGRSEQAALSHQPAKTKSGTVRASAAGATVRPAALAVSTSRCSRA